MDFADIIDLKFLMKIRIIIKKAIVFYYIKKFNDGKDCLNEA